VSALPREPQPIAEPGIAEPGIAEPGIAEAGAAGPVLLPDPVRHRVVAAAADVLPSLEPEDVPAPLRPFTRFTASRRTRLGGAAIAVALESDGTFRQRVADRVAEQSGELGTAIATGVAPAAADPTAVAVLAYLLRPAGWRDLVSTAASAVEAVVDRGAARAAEQSARRQAEQVEKVRTQARTEIERARAEIAAARADVEQLRSRVRLLAKQLRVAESQAGSARAALAAERGRAAASASAADAEARRLRARLADAGAAAEAARRAAREGRAADEVRLWLLLDTAGRAISGLRQELALGPGGTLPADLVAAVRPTSTPVVPTARALAADDPGRLDELLALPRVHLVIDGYNVTKTGFGELSLEQQRTRLIGGLGAVAAQTGAEVTVVFDGAGRLPSAPAAPRGVRVLFSEPGVIADEVIRRLVRAEPPGRPVVVVSSDREVADGVREAEAYPLSATTLLRRLGRG
jgi:predicted RNA-binding protein with PIN domain